MQLLSSDLPNPMGQRDHLVIYLNGKRVVIASDDAALTLAEFLRSRQAKLGTKIVCNEGDCGACSVLVGKPSAIGTSLDYVAIDSCIAFLFQLDRTHVVTVEGLTTNGKLTPVQDAMIRCHGSQCGFCTPGFVTTMHAMVESNQTLDDASLRYGLSGNLCRCTGYTQILQAGTSIDSSSVPKLSVRYPDEPILRDFASLGPDPVCIATNTRTIFVPRTVSQAIDIRASHPQATIISGATDYGVSHNHGRTATTDLLCLSSINGLRDIYVRDNTLVIGAMASWIDIEHAVKSLLPEYHQILTRFGSPQIRQMGTIGGNLASGSPIADSVPLHIVLASELELISSRGTRRVSLQDFYLGYRKTMLRDDELIAYVHTPLPRDDEHIKLYKISKRRDMDISTLTFGIWLKRSGGTIQDVRLALGGVGPTVMRIDKAEAALRGKPWTETTFQAAGRIAREQITPWTDVRGSADYRLALTENLLVKSFLETSE